MALVNQEEIAIPVDSSSSRKFSPSSPSVEHPHRDNLGVQFVDLAVPFPHLHERCGAEDDRATPFGALEVLDDRRADEALAQANDIGDKDSAVVANHLRRLPHRDLLEVREPGG